MLFGFEDHHFHPMMDLETLSIPEKNIKKKDHLVVDSILFLVSKKLFEF
jgi:hypothetical protein